MKTTHEKTHSENGEGECWWSRIASPYPDVNSVAPPATDDVYFSKKADTDRVD